MIISFLSELGIWNWLIFGLLLLILELFAPGIFFIWFGIAALITGALAFLFGATSAFGWQTQTILFLVLAIVAVLLGRRFFGSSDKPEDEPFLNRRGDEMVGQRATLSEAIVNGYGRIKINDTTWRVNGPDLPKGASVRIVAFDQGTLVIEEADAE